jgi:hypothetical protein
MSSSDNSPNSLLLFLGADGQPFEFIGGDGQEIHLIGGNPEEPNNREMESK